MAIITKKTLSPSILNDAWLGDSILTYFERKNILKCRGVRVNGRKSSNKNLKKAILSNIEIQEKFKNHKFPFSSALDAECMGTMLEALIYREFRINQNNAIRIILIILK